MRGLSRPVPDKIESPRVASAISRRLPRDLPSGAPFRRTAHAVGDAHRHCSEQACRLGACFLVV